MWEGKEKRNGKETKVRRRKGKKGR